MDTVLLIIGGLGGFALGILLGLFAGARVREVHQGVYWALNGVVIIVGIAGNTYGLLNEMMWLVIASLAFIGGGIAGLKYGYAEVVGQWRRSEDVFEDDPRS